MKKVIVILFLLVGGLAAYLYWVEPETLDRLLKRDPGAAPAGKSPAAGGPVRPKAPKNRATKANARLVIPETEATVYINGKRTPAGTAKVPAGGVFVASYRDGRYSHERVPVPEGGEALAQLHERESAGNTTWTTFQGNPERTGYANAHDRQVLALNWHKALGIELESALIAVENQAFFSAEDHLINGLDLATGELLWSQGSMGAAVTPIANSQHVFAGSDSGRFGAYRLKDGKPRGDRFIDSYPTSMALISEDAFLVTNGGSRVFSIKTKKGFTGKLPLKVNWENDFAELAGKPSTPALGGGKAIFMTERSGLLALDLASGNKLWTRTLTAADGTDAAALGAGGNMSLHLVDDEVPVPSPTMVDDTVYAGQGNALMAAHTGAGRVLWQVSVEGTIASPLSCAYGMLFYGTTGGEIHGVSTLDGSTLFRVGVGDGAVTAAPAVFKDKLLVGTAEGRLFLLNCFSGEMVAESDVLAGAPIVGTPVVTDRFLVAANKQGKVACFK